MVHEAPEELMLVKAVRPASLRGTSFVRLTTEDACHRMSEIAQEHDLPADSCVFVIVPYSRRLRVDTNHNAARALQVMVGMVNSLPPDLSTMRKPELQGFVSNLRMFILQHSALCDVDPGMEGTC